MKYSILKTAFAAMLFIASSEASAQFKTTFPLPKTVAHGTLSNGMQYFIMHNEWPKNRADFYFVQNVGAILENDDQDGLAHFLEHMAFNGTEHFKGKGIINMLEKQGVSFGKDINAYTAYDETVYNLSNVPADNRVLLDSCMYVLHDWSGSLLLADNEIEAERGVIREEWRTRRNADYRAGEKIDKTVFEGSKYAKRNVIGDLNVINNFKYQVLRDYYKKWYQPQNQAVIIVGDIDVTLIEKRVKEIFGSIPTPKNITKREYEKIPVHKENRYVLATDKELQRSGISLSYTKPKPMVQDDTEMKNSMNESLAMQMMNTRFNEYIINNETAGLSFGIGDDNLSRLDSKVSLHVTPKKGKFLEAFSEAYREFERAIQNGFTQQELDRLKTKMRSSYDNRLANKDKIGNAYWAEQLQLYFLEANPIMTVEEEHNWINSFLDKVTLEQINAAFKALKTQENLVLSISAPEDATTKFPEENEYWNAIKTLSNTKLEPYKEEELTASLVTDQLTAKAIAKTSDVKAFANAKQYTLANGAKVIIYPTTLSNDQILFSAYSPGGNSLVEWQDLPSAQLAASLAAYSGLGNYKYTDLKKKINGKTVSLSPYIGGLYEGFNGSSNKESLTTLLQLTYLYFQHPRFDESTFDKLKEQYQNKLNNAQNNNEKVLSDTISLLNSNYSKRDWLLTQDFIKAFDLNKIKKFYTERFSNASDFTFLFVGTISDKDIALINTYLGSIPSTQKVENYVDHKIFMKSGTTEKTIIRTMDTPKTTVYLHLENQDVAYTKKNKILSYVISEWLTKRYLETIREEEGGSYGVQVGADLSQSPTPLFSLEINFDCNPDKADTLVKIVHDELARIQNENIPANMLEDIKQSILKNYQEQIKENSYWLNSLTSYLRNNEAPLDTALLKSTLNTITPKEVKEFTANALKKSNSVQVLMKAK
ncbi:insulinase family protein [Flavobacterium sp. MC2016-06]|uniref:M16 family metallopeptidase n=1 Tax=Flavobacterium sp. MC2016-06 TaxID=2676308 RepID=UPI0012BA731F|nr:insulinase family protein [Flavobacterium sp. MC2016-06]MBU3860324.1 insulinase family protein [Flavobacterium sp. MC2016-06]